jgi:uncharacterized protein YjiS (DUF1127 family)
MSVIVATTEAARRPWVAVNRSNQHLIEVNMNATLRTHSSASAAVSVERFLRAAFEQVANAVANYRAAAEEEMKTQQAIQELNGLSDHELRDIGLTRGEIESAVRRLR